MARRCLVCSHPERTEIEKALIRNESLRNIGNRFGISDTAVLRHRDKHLPETLLEAKEAEKKVYIEEIRNEIESKQTKQTAHARDIMTELERCFERANLLFDACDRWLRDADDPNRYDIGPRAEDITVTYLKPAGEDGKPVKRKKKLSDLLSKVEAGLGVTVELVETKHADPRELILKTAGRLQAQTELLAKLIGALKDGTTIQLTGKDGGPIQLEDVSVAAGHFDSLVARLISRSELPEPVSIELDPHGEGEAQIRVGILGTSQSDLP